MLYVILDNIRSAYNVGAIFRTADAVGVEKIFLCGYTPAPRDRFGREMPEIAKTSLGAAARVPWQQYTSTTQVVDELTAQGIFCVAIEQTSTATSLYETTFTGPTAVVFGNEVSGVSPEVLAVVAASVELPMYGMKESLNVSVTAGIVLYELRHHHQL